MVKLWVLATAALLVCAAAAPLVQEDTFENIKNAHGDQLVVFYKSSDPEAERVLKIVKKVAKEIKEDYPSFSFKKCDGDRSENQKEFSEASFHKGVFLFTSTSVEGIVKYSGPVNAKSLALHIRSKYMDHDEEDVLQFEDEDALFERIDTTGRPVFVKFFEQWCEHCKRLKTPFNIAATYFKDKVDFMEVECSKNEDTTPFCTRNEVRSYPVLMLFTGEEKIPFKDEMRAIVSFEKFFEEHVFNKSSGDDDAAAAPAAAAADEEEEEEEKPKKKAKKSKAAKKDKKKGGKKSKPVADDDDDELASLGAFSKPAADAGAADAKAAADAAASSSSGSLEDRVARLEAAIADLTKTVKKLAK